MCLPKVHYESQPDVGFASCLCKTFLTICLCRVTRPSTTCEETDLDEACTASSLGKPSKGPCPVTRTTFSFEQTTICTVRLNISPVHEILAGSRSQVSWPESPVYTLYSQDPVWHQKFEDASRSVMQHLVHATPSIWEKLTEHHWKARLIKAVGKISPNFAGCLGG